MKADGNDGFVLSTGKRVYANRRLVSIPIIEKEDGHFPDDPLKFAEGYDGSFHVGNPKDADYHEEENITWLLTVDEGIEVCDAMIEAWKRRRAKIKKMLE